MKNIKFPQHPAYWSNSPLTVARALRSLFTVVQNVLPVSSSKQLVKRRDAFARLC